MYMYFFNANAWEQRCVSIVHALRMSSSPGGGGGGIVSNHWT